MYNTIIINDALTDKQKQILEQIKQKDSWCAGFYTINFQTNEFIAEFGGIKKRYSLDNLPTVEQFLFDFKSGNDELQNYLTESSEIDDEIEDALYESSFQVADTEYLYEDPHNNDGGHL